MKLTKKDLRNLIINEINILNEESSDDLDPTKDPFNIQKQAVRKDIQIASKFFINLNIHKKDIDEEYASMFSDTEDQLSLSRESQNDLEEYSKSIVHVNKLFEDTKSNKLFMRKNIYEKLHNKIKEITSNPIWEKYNSAAASSTNQELFSLEDEELILALGSMDFKTFLSKISPPINGKDKSKKKNWFEKLKAQKIGNISNYESGDDKGVQRYNDNVQSEKSKSFFETLLREMSINGRK
jgi:hypothetical protein